MTKLPKLPKGHLSALSVPHSKEGFMSDMSTRDITVELAHIYNQRAAARHV